MRAINPTYRLQRTRYKLWEALVAELSPLVLEALLDLGSFLNNPALMNMASTMLQDPNMQNMMAQMMGGMGGGPPGAGGPGGPGGQPNIEGLLQ